MIVYSLRCHKDHQFEAWFRSSGAFDEQAAADEILCPHCGSTDVEKAIMAPRLSRRSEGEAVAAGQATTARQDQTVMEGGAARRGNGATGVAAAPREQRLRAMLVELRREIEARCDYVGKDFAEVARQIHYGETEARGIYGETTDAEAAELAEEGVEFARVPWPSRDDA